MNAYAIGFLLGFKKEAAGFARAQRLGAARAKAPAGSPKAQQLSERLNPLEARLRASASRRGMYPGQREDFQALARESSPFAEGAAKAKPVTKAQEASDKNKTAPVTAKAPATAIETPPVAATPAAAAAPAAVEASPAAESALLPGAVESAADKQPLMHTIMGGIGRATHTGLWNLDPRLANWAARASRQKPENLGALMAGLLPSAYYMATEPNYNSYGPGLYGQYPNSPFSGAR